MFFFVVPSEDTKIRRPELLDKLGTEEMTILFREAYGILHNKEAAYDVLDSALVKALWRNPPHGENRLLYWMVQLVQSEAYAYHKRFSLRAWWTRAKRCPRKPPYNGAAQYLAIRARKNARLRAAIEALKSPEKEILNMRIHEKKDFPEIAEKLHMSNAAVRSQYRRILKKAQRAWAEDTPEQI